MPLWKTLARRFGLEASLTNIEAGNSAPHFSLKALDGKQYSLDSLLARGPLVLAFFKISCPVCQFTFPFSQRIAERFADKNASVVGVSQDDARDTKEFNQEYGVTFPTLLDDAGYPASNAFGLTNVPTIFLIAPDGTVSVVVWDSTRRPWKRSPANCLSSRKSPPARCSVPMKLSHPINLDEDRKTRSGRT